MRALGASRARILHVSRPSRHVAPLVLPTPQPRHALPFSPERAKQPWCIAAPPSEPLAARRRPQRASARSVPPRPLPLATCPGSRASLSPRSSASSRRRHDALTLQGGGPLSFLSGRPKPTSSRYIRRPPNSFEHARNLRPPPQSAIVGGSRLPRLRPVRPPQCFSPIRREPSPSSPTSITNLLLSPLRSRPTPQTRSIATGVQTPNTPEATGRRGAHRRRLTPSPPASRPPEGPP